MTMYLCARLTVPSMQIQIWLKLSKQLTKSSQTMKTTSDRIDTTESAYKSDPAKLRSTGDIPARPKPCHAQHFKAQNNEAAIGFYRWLARTRRRWQTWINNFESLSFYGDLESALALHYLELTEKPLKVRSYKQLFVTLRSFGLNGSAACVDRTLVP